jgi:hypothetical protein
MGILPGGLDILLYNESRLEDSKSPSCNIEHLCYYDIVKSFAVLPLHLNNRIKTRKPNTIRILRVPETNARSGRGDSRIALPLRFIRTFPTGGLAEPASSRHESPLFFLGDRLYEHPFLVLGCRALERPRIIVPRCFNKEKPISSAMDGDIPPSPLRRPCTKSPGDYSFRENLKLGDLNSANDPSCFRDFVVAFFNLTSSLPSPDDEEKDEN